MLDAYPDWKIPAHVIAIIPTADRSKATVKVRVAIDQKDPRILPDMGVRVSFLGSRSGRAASARRFQHRREAASGAGDSRRTARSCHRSASRRASGKSVVFDESRDAASSRAAVRVTRRTVLRRSASWSRASRAGTRVVRAPPADMRDGATVTVQAGHDRHAAAQGGNRMSALVEIRNVSKVYERGKQKVEVLHHIDLDIAKGDFVALMGPSGSGKTTLLNLIGGLDSPDRRQHHRRRRAHRPARRGRAGEVARRARRLRVPVLQPAADAVGAAGTSSCRCC